LSSMSPTIVLRGGKPILAVGAAGGPTIISQTLWTILQAVDFGRSPADALAQPRLHHQWRPDELVMESTWNSGVVEAVRSRGHSVRSVKRLGAAQAVGRTDAGLEAASDPRLHGSGTVWREGE